MIRRKFVRFLNAVIAFSFLGLLIVYMQSPYSSRKDGTNYSPENIGQSLLTSAIDYQVSNEKGWNFSNGLSSLSKSEIVRSIEFLNANYEVLNVDKFGPVHNVQTIIVVQVHNRIEYLRILIETLKEAKYISEALLIFSHDYSSSSINRLVKSIEFCRVMQIYYPYSIQLFLNEYPGEDPTDCSAKMTMETAESVKCKNWRHPDKYGHYRIAKLTQIKHHWWWKMNYIFDGVMKQYGLTNASVVLLEEDHYVSPDFLHVMRIIIDNKKTFCDECQIVSLGSYLKKYNNFEEEISHLGVHPWFSSKHNMGMVIDLKTWHLIKNCTMMFCKYDDYNWDWSLLHISTKCLRTRLRVIVVKASRVIHIGDCGVHTHRCAVHNAAEKAKEVYAKAAKSLFPDKMTVVEHMKRTLKPSKENGGWGDARDHELCLNNSIVPNLLVNNYSLRTPLGLHHRNMSVHTVPPL